MEADYLFSSSRRIITLITYIRFFYVQSFLESLIKQITEPLVELDSKDKLNARLKNKKKSNVVLQYWQILMVSFFFCWTEALEPWQIH